MAAKRTPPCLVVVNAVPRDHAPKRCTVTPSQGAPYVMQLPPGKPVVLVGPDEIRAIQKYLACPTIEWLTLTPEQSQSILGDLVEKAAADEISKLRQRIATLETRLESVSLEPVTA